MHTRRAFLPALLLLLSSSLSPAAATEWHVDVSVEVSGDGETWETAFKTIQEGLDFAADGDTVIVAGGTYFENIHFDGKNVVLRSVDPTNSDVVDNTIIDGNQAGPVVTFSGGEGETCALLGFTIMNGLGNAGGGIHGNWTPSTLARIANNRIIGNSAAWGGGISHCDGIIENNTITGNSAKSGGGISSCRGMILRNVIVDNTASIEGGGLYGCPGLIQGNLISRNLATSASKGRGGGLSFCSGVVQSNLITSNRASGTSLLYGGGGLYLCTGLVQNNTIVGNWAAEHGGALARVSAKVVNCIIWGNTPTRSGQVYESPSVTYCCIEEWAMGGPGNISSDPLFAADDRLGESSPCIDNGLNGHWEAWPTRDMDGNSRVVNGTVDMGCYEFGATPDSDGDLLSDLDEHARGTDESNRDTDGDEIQDGLELIVGMNPTLPDRRETVRVPEDVATIQLAISVCARGGKVIVSPGTYHENLRFPGWNLTLRSANPTSHAVVTSTVLDGSMSGSVITFTGEEDETTVVSGFTIRNGEAVLGGGIYGKHNFARIEHNVFTDNAAQGGGAINNCDGIIQNNSFQRNTAGKHGGGALAWCEGVIRNNGFSENAGADGGALHYCGGVIQNNLITRNQATSCGGGLSACNGTVEGNIISDNVAAYDGGGISSFHGTVQRNVIIGNRAMEGGGLCWVSGKIANNLIAGNSATERGGGICWHTDGCLATFDGDQAGRTSNLDHSNEIILNNTIVNNSAGESGGGICWSFVDCMPWPPDGEAPSDLPLSDPEYGGPIRNCIIWGNSAPTGAQVRIDPKYPRDFRFCCIQDWTGGGEGNITLDPRFIDPDGPDNIAATCVDNDYRLSATSACIDAGDNSPLSPPELDLDRNKRIAFGHTSLTVDMGAYEYNSLPLVVSRLAADTKEGFRLTWISSPGASYTVWSCLDVSATAWTQEATISSQGEETSWTDSGSLPALKVYRIELK